MIYLVFFAAMLIFAIYAFTKLRRRSSKPFPMHWHDILINNVDFYKDLSIENQQVFQKRIMLFLAEVHIESVKTEVEELDKILIAASAIIPVFGFKEWHFENLSGVILYPNSFNHDLQFSTHNEDRRILGMVGTGQFEKQMILSKKAIRLAFKNETDKLNTPVHEFVHLMDKKDGKTDGIPELLLGKEFIAPWLQLMHKEMERINDDKSDIRKYGGTSETEFFAVASEYFFERPKLFKKKHPELYDMLVMCFNQNPVKKK